MSFAQHQEFVNSVSQIQKENEERELHWFINHTVIPEFPQIIETLSMCSNLLLYNSPQHPDPKNRIERGPPVKLPVSTSKLEKLKGIVVRDGAYVTQFQVVTRDHYFNKCFNKLNLTKPILLSQVINTKVAIDDSIQLMESLSKLSKAEHEHKDDKDHEDYHRKLYTSFRDLLSKVQTAKTSLQLPTDPHLVFPMKLTPRDYFAPELPPTITVDFYISQAEICIDMKSLHRITEKPWSEVDSKTGKSYVDKLREEMKLTSTDLVLIEGKEKKKGVGGTAESSSTLNSSKVALRSNSVTPAASISDISERADLEGLASHTLLKQSSSDDQTQGFLSSMMSHIQFKPKHDPNEYIMRCVTYNHMVVTINSKIEVSSEDPILVSCFTKLDTIEYLIRKILDSLDIFIT